MRPSRRRRRKRRVVQGILKMTIIPKSVSCRRNLAADIEPGQDFVPTNSAGGQNECQAIVPQINRVADIGWAIAPAANMRGRARQQAIVQTGCGARRVCW